ncbi:sigma-70 family RNA polymerase sigma factor [Sphingobium ummariense]
MRMVGERPTRDVHVMKLSRIPRSRTFHHMSERHHRALHFPCARPRVEPLPGSSYFAMTRVTDDRALWLGQHILPHESALRAWLSRRRVGELDVDDIIQEAYARLITAPTVHDIRNPKSYLFQVARSVIATNLRGTKVVTIVVSDPEVLSIPAQEPSAEVQLSDRQELQRLIEAIAALSEPTRTIFRLRRIEQLPQRAIAQRLAMPESTVEKHISRALSYMSDLFGRGGKNRLLASRDMASADRIENEAANSKGD